LLAEVAAGVYVVIIRCGKPVARIVPAPAAATPVFDLGALLSTVLPRDVSALISFTPSAFAFSMHHDIWRRYQITEDNTLRTWVDIPDWQIKDLMAICKAEKVSRAEVIRQAISCYLEKKKPQTVDAFGLWKDHPVDGLTYQEQARSEWQAPCSIPTFLSTI
jgi:antitoxin (DNA-binding transcriptional repressor) of toxin-antitoxin stability system